MPNLRMIPKDLEFNVPDIEKYEPTINEKFKWEHITCRLVTRQHGGGVKANKKDEDLPVRVAAIRGQLRFWWRILAEYKWHIAKEDLRRQEFALWGGMSDEGCASLVFLRTQWKDIKKFKKWTLQWRFNEQILDCQKKQVLETLKWWATLDGIGGHTRRGYGAFEVAEWEPISEQEMKELGCFILHSDSLKEPIKAWEDATSKWKEIHKEKESSFEELLNENERHLTTVLRRPVRHSSKWRGMIIVLPNSSKKVKEILGVTK